MFLRTSLLILAKMSVKLCFEIEMVTAQRTRPRAVVGAPHRAAWQLKSSLRHRISAAPRTIIFYIFFTIITGELFLYVQEWLVMMQL